MLFALLIFLILALSAGILWARRLVRSVLMLLGAVVALAFVFFGLGAEAAGAAQLLVYAGGVMILLLFGVMSTAHMDSKRGPVSTPTAVYTGLFVAICLILALGAALLPALSGLPSALPAFTGGSLAATGAELVAHHAAPLELAAVLLLMALAFAVPFVAKK